MSSRWSSKLVVFTAALMLTLPVLAFAQTSRLEGMGNLQGDYVKDYTSIFAYPSQVSNVGNLVYGEFGTSAGIGGTPTDRAVGAVLGNLWDGRMGTWAIHLRQTTPQLGRGDAVGGSNPGDFGNDPNLNTNESFDLMWGRKFGTANFGARLNRSFYETESSDAASTTKLAFDPAAASPTEGRNIFGLAGGVGFEMNPNTNLDFGILYQSRTYEQTNSPPAAGDETEDSPTTYLVSARAMWQWQSNVMVTPVFKWYSFDLSRQETTPAATFDNTLKGWQIGAAGNWSLGSNDLFVLGAAFVQNKVEQDEELIVGPAIDDKEITETLSPLVFAALETHVNSWLTLRFGANKAAISKIKGEPRVTTNPTEQTTSSTFEMTLGTGVKVGTLQFDAVLANSTYQFAGGVLGGTTPGAGFFPKVTATYSF